jgi:hypothetical protein
LDRRFGLRLPEGRVAEVVAAATSAEDAAARQDRREGEVAKLKAWIQSPDAPFNPTDEEWATLAASLDGGTPEKVGTVVAGLASFKASGAPERLAADVGETLLTRLRDELERSRSEDLLKRLTAGVDLGPQPDVVTARLRGVLAELLGGEADPAEKPMTFTISGMPAVLHLVEGQLLHGIRVSALIVLVVFTLVTLLVAAIGRRPGDIRAIPEAAVAGLVTWALGWALGIQVDSGSATLYLLPLTVSWFLSPRLSDPRAAPGRYALTFAAAFAAGGLSLLLTGVMPVVRLGAVMALGLLASAGVAAAGDWLWEPVQAGRVLVKEFAAKAKATSGFSPRPPTP